MNMADEYLCGIPRGDGYMKKIRHYSRYIVTGGGTLSNGNAPEISFKVKDMSASGINITTGEDMEKQSVVSMNIRLSGNVSALVKEVKGLIVRKQKLGNNYQYGINFIEHSDKDMTEIDEYLQLNFGSRRIDSPDGEPEPGENPLKLLKRDSDT